MSHFSTHFLIVYIFVFILFIIKLSETTAVSEEFWLRVWSQFSDILPELDKEATSCCIDILCHVTCHSWNIVPLTASLNVMQS